MRSLVAILLLALLLLYHGAFYSVYWLASHQIDRHWQTQKPVAKEKLSRLAIPIKIPYKSYQESYMQTQGKIIHEGRVYRAMYQKYQNDSLFILAAEDQLTAHLHASIKDWIDSANQSQKRNDSASILISCAKHFNAPDHLMGPENTFSAIKSNLTEYQSLYSAPEIEGLLRPPIG